MKIEELERTCSTIRKYASSFGNVKKDADVLEICDFGDSYGFLFEVNDKFANLYWCEEKETHKLYTFRPNMDMTKFMNRKILSKDTAG